MMQSANTLPPVAMHKRINIVALVSLLHALPMLVWLMQEKPVNQALSEITVSMLMPVAETVAAQPALVPQQPVPQQKNEPAKPVTPAPMTEQLNDALPAPVTETAQKAIAPTISTQSINTAANAPANYLSNPRPAYPVAARRRGYEGRVILNIEVLAEGRCGEISVFQSSGHEILDKAALSAVKDWRFIPARIAGQPVTQWLKVPINFSLESEDA